MNSRFRLVAKDDFIQIVRQLFSKLLLYQNSGVKPRVAT